MNSIAVFLLFAIATSAVLVSSSGDCPPSSKVTSCSPKCLQDTECSSMGGRCCPNLCNYKSCVIPKGNQAAGNKYASGGGSSGGAYCGNVKCNAFEKCDTDRTTKRPKCVRA